jgi:hypothetical protein
MYENNGSGTIIVRLNHTTKTGAGKTSAKTAHTGSRPGA